MRTVCSCGRTWGGGVSAPGGICSRGGVLWRGCLVLRGGVCSCWGVCSGGCLHWGVSALGGVWSWEGGGCVYSRGVSALGGLLWEGVCSRGLFGPGERGLLQGGGLISQHALRQTPPPRGQTPACKNITFATSLRTVIIMKQKIEITGYIRLNSVHWYSIDSWWTRL